METPRGRPLLTPPDRTTVHAGPTTWLTARPIALAMVWLLLAPLLVIVPQPTADAIEDGADVEADPEPEPEDVPETLTGNIAGHALFDAAYAQVGIRPNAAFGTGGDGAEKSDLEAIGFLPQDNQGLGFVAIRDLEAGWVEGNIDGDFFVPGEPYEGWVIQIGEERTHFDDVNNVSTGTLGTATFEDGIHTVDWSHTVSGLDIDKVISLGDDQQEVVIDVTLTNTSDQMLEEVFYGRGYDPDNTNYAAEDEEFLERLIELEVEIPQASSGGGGDSERRKVHLAVRRPERGDRQPCAGR